MMGFPDDRRPTRDEQLAGTLFESAPMRRPGPDPDLLYGPLPTPSGPQTPARTRAMNSFNAYCAWKRSEEGGKAFGWMLVEARRQAVAGAERIGVKALAESCRAALKTELNNTWVSWVSDDLVAADERLLPLIERRQRRKARA